MYPTEKKNEITLMAKELFREERARKRLDGWFRILETELFQPKLS